MDNRRLGKKIKDICIVILGWLCIIGGIAGLFLPIVQGILLLLLGLFLLAKRYRWARRLLEKLRCRYPHIFYKAHENAHKVKRYFKKLFRKS
ncbi:MAG: PGPGW domain-containing protein [Clostridia bacterium]|jgi:uncharacterized membrane protein YbaN (DUF454 family)|nr:PGPGW domain-containing protein [Clostridia bacterium]